MLDGSRPGNRPNGEEATPASSGVETFTLDDLLLAEDRGPPRPKAYGAAEPIDEPIEVKADFTNGEAEAPEGLELEAEDLSAALGPAKESHEAGSTAEGDAVDTGVSDTAASKPADYNVFSSAVFLMSRSAKHRHLFLADLEWRLMPPLALKQFRLFTKDNHPVALATWAMVSEAVEARLKGGGTHLKPEEWKSGDRRVVVDIVAPFGGEKEKVQLTAKS